MHIDVNKNLDMIDENIDVIDANINVIDVKIDVIEDRQVIELHDELWILMMGCFMISMMIWFMSVISM